MNGPLFPHRLRRRIFSFDVKRGLTSSYQLGELYNAMGKALDEWISASVGSSGLVVTSGMSYSVRKGYLVPEVARLVDMYRNTTLMIAHIIHRLVVKASQLAPKVNKTFLHLP